MSAILTLDNRSARKIDDENVPKNLNIYFLPLNTIDRHQTAEMGMIARHKVGHESNHLRSLLEMFDAPGGCEHAAK